MDKKPTFFPIYHFSPGGAIHVVECIKELNPKLVLVECPTDYEEMIDSLIDPQNKFPISFVSFKDDSSIYYPFDINSPELQTFIYCKENNVDVHPFDIPSYFGLNDEQKDFLLKKVQWYKMPFKRESTELLFKEVEKYFKNFELTKPDDLLDIKLHTNYYLEHLLDHSKSWKSYKEMTNIVAKNSDVDLEMNILKLTYLGLHNSEDNVIKQLFDKYINFITFYLNVHYRNSYMKFRINEYINQGIEIDNILVVCGASHSLMYENEFISYEPKDEKTILKIVKSYEKKLIPYSSMLLSQFKGYGAGNKAPIYFRMLYQHLKMNKLNYLPFYYISMIGNEIKKENVNVSPAHLQEVYALACSLAQTRSYNIPGIIEIEESFVSVLAFGNKSIFEHIFTKVGIGNLVGEVESDKNASLIVEDFKKQIQILRLEKNIETNESIKLKLGKRTHILDPFLEKLDIHRSSFLNRLMILKISGFKIYSEQFLNIASKTEKWYINTNAKTYLTLSNAIIYGKTIEEATTYILRKELETASDLSLICETLKKIVCCGLDDLFSFAISMLKKQTFSASDIQSLVELEDILYTVITFADCRDISKDVDRHLFKLLYEKFVSCLYQYTNSDNDTSRRIKDSILIQLRITSRIKELDSMILLDELTSLFVNNTYETNYLHGFVHALLFEYKKINDLEFSTCFYRALKSTVSNNIKFSYIEAVLEHFYNIFSKSKFVWQAIDKFIQNLDEEEFKLFTFFFRKGTSKYNDEQRKTIISLVNNHGNNQQKSSEDKQMEFEEFSDDILALLNQL